MDRHGRRRLGAKVLVGLASVLLVLATLAGYARRTLFDSDQFSNRAASTLQADSVKSLIAERVTDQLVLAHQADLLAVRPLIESAVSSIVSGSAFRTLFVKAVGDAHRAVFSHDENTLILTLSDVGSVAAAGLEKLRPDLAAELNRGGRVTLVNNDVGHATGGLARLARRVRALAILLVALTLAAGVGAVVIAPDRRRTVAQLGLAVAVAGIAIVVAYTVARAIVLSHFSDPQNKAAAGAVWSAFLQDLRTFGWVLAGSGAVVAAAATSRLRPVEVEGRFEQAFSLVATEPKSTFMRVVRAVCLIVVGGLVVAQPSTALQVVATLLGVYLIYLGAEAILRVIEPAHKEPLPVTEPDPKRRWHFRARRLIVPGVAALVVVGALTGFFAGGGVTAPAAAPITKCNGFAALCDRPLYDVALPATHNSMSVPLPGWFSSEQDRPIGGQLDDGIRGLLLDTHYGDKLSNGRVRTELGNNVSLQQLAQQDGVSQQSVEAALRLRSRLGFKGKGKRGMYLCHTFCELGATPLATGLGDIKQFLVTHPDEVMVVINQDYVTPADLVKAIGDAGLTQYVFKELDKPTWPTLKQMIQTNQRLVLLAENHAGAAPWYQLAYKRLTEETPYTFRKVSLLTDEANLAASCVPNRGPEKAPLFLVNHWISTDPIPLPSDADKVNAYEPLLNRMRACQMIRGHLPNLVAVNFYKHGDVFSVVNTLNGVG
jgi:hypothetical protein